MLQVTMVIISFLTNILVDLLSEDCSDGDIQQVLSEVLSGGNGVFDFCITFPAIQIFLALPNVRLRPLWYSQHRSSILHSLHQGWLCFQRTTEVCYNSKYPRWCFQQLFLVVVGL